MLTNYDLINTTFGKLNYNDVILYEGKVYKILEKFHSKPGKHGAAKIKLICSEYFNEVKKQNITMPSGAAASKIIFSPGIAYISKLFPEGDVEGIDLYSKDIKDKSGLINLKNKQIVELTIFLPEIQQTYFISPNPDLMNQEGLEVKYILTEYGRKIISLK